MQHGTWQSAQVLKELKNYPPPCCIHETMSQIIATGFTVYTLIPFVFMIKALANQPWTHFISDI